MAKALTTVAVINAKSERGRRREIPDGGCSGLHLIIQPSGTKSWAVRYRFKGHPRKLTLGRALVGDHVEPVDMPGVDTPLSLVAARELATKALRQVAAGIDPTVEKRRSRAAAAAAVTDSFASVVDEFIRRRGASLRSVKQRAADLALLVEPRGSHAPLGPLAVDTITRAQFSRALDDIADERGTGRADRCLGALSSLLNWHGRRSDYVSVLARGMQKVRASDRARDRVLSDDELRAVWTTAETFPAPFGAYIRFLLLTAVRRTEAAGMRFDELVADDTWIIPSARYKSGREMLVPLSKAAQAIVAGQLRTSAFVFTAGNRPLAGFAKRKKDFNLASGVTNWTLHDLRRTSRTLLSRAGVSADTAERCLGHALTGVRATYDRHEYEREKRHAFEALATLIERIVNPPTGGVLVDFERAKRQ